MNSTDPITLNWDAVFSQIGFAVGMLTIVFAVGWVILGMLGDDLADFFMGGALLFAVLYIVPHLFGVW